MAETTVKEEARQLVDGLGEDATWEDVVYVMYLREKLERGRKDSALGRVASLDEVRRRFGVGSA